MVMDYEGQRHMVSEVETPLTDIISVSRASAGYALRSDGIIQSFSANEPRVTDLGLLVEEETEYLFTQSDDFSHADWNKTNVTVTANDTTSPLGTTTGHRITADGSNATHDVSQVIASLSTEDYCGMMFAKEGTERYAYINFDTSVLGNGLVIADLQDFSITHNSNPAVFDVGIKQLGSTGWAYIYIIGASGGGTNKNIRYGVTSNSTSKTSTASGYIHAFWGQFTQSSHPMSYFPTTTSSATRNSDNITLSDTSWLTTDAGTILIEAAKDVHQPNVVALGFNSGAHGIETSGAPYELEHYDGSNILATRAPYQRTTSKIKGVFAWNSKYRFLAAGGGAVAFDEGGSGTQTDWNIGMREGGSKHWNGLIKQLAFKQTCDNMADISYNSDPDPNYYDVLVDSNQTSSGNVIQTLDELDAKITGNDMIVGIQAGSVFNGQSGGYSGFDRHITRKVGTGADPILFGRPVVDTWTKVVGRTNIYEADIDLSDFSAFTDTIVSVYESTGTATDVSTSDNVLQEYRGFAEVTNITQANPAVITFADIKNLQNGDTTTLRSVGGMIELNDTTVTLANISGDTAELSGVDSTAHTAYTSGGTAQFTAETNHRIADGDAGSFVVDTATEKVYLHTSNSDNPNTNGRCYSATQIENMLNSPFMVRGLVYDSPGADDNIKPKHAYDMTVLHGITHNMVLKEDEYLRSTAYNVKSYDCRSHDGLYNGQSAGVFVWNPTTVGTNTAYVEKFNCYQDLSLTALNNPTVGAFGCHDGGGSETLGLMVLENCYAENGNNFFSAGNCVRPIVRNCRMINMATGIEATAECTSAEIEANFATGTSSLHPMSRFWDGAWNAAATININGNFIQSYTNSGGCIWIKANGVFVLRYNTFEGSNHGSGNLLGVRIQNSSATVTVERNIFENITGWGIYVDGAYAANLTNDNNVLGTNSGGNHYNGTNHTAIGTWRTATGEGTNSVYEDPVFVGTTTDYAQLSDVVTSAAIC